MVPLPSAHAARPAVPIASDVDQHSRPAADQPTPRDAGDVASWAGLRVAFAGVGGAGMSALTRLVAAMGARVWGFDAVASPVTDALASEGLSVVIADEPPLPHDADLVVASAAIPAANGVLAQARARGIAVLPYARALGLAMRERTGVAIAGTHGKSTTAAMLTAALVDAGLDPSAIVGAGCRQITAGALAAPGRAVGSRLGAARYADGGRWHPGLLVAEACEFNRSFLSLHPTVACVGPVEADHLDVYGSLEAVVGAFNAFARLLPAPEAGGVLLIAHDCPHRLAICRGVAADVRTVGFSATADWSARYDPAARSVEAAHKGQPIARWRQPMAGEHNAANALMALAAACELGAEPAVVARSLGAFAGVERRCQPLGDRPLRGGGSVRVWDDYGHHPTEVDATLRAIRQTELADRPGRLVVVFQPHQHSRTRLLMDGFERAFFAADEVVVPDIYFVRDGQAERRRVSAGDLVARLRARGVNAAHVHPFEAVVDHLESVCRDGDVVVVMGAGPIWRVAQDFMRPCANAGAQAGTGAARA